MMKKSGSSTSARGFRCAGISASLAAAWVALALVPARASTTSDKVPEFKYAGGTEDVAEGCVGHLQLGAEAMAFECAQYSVNIPYNSIQLMQYRAGVSRQVRRLKPRWKVTPPYFGGSKNRYFTVVYQTSGTRHIIVLDVPSGGMLPYLAEIDLKAGHRVDVERHEDYE